jgi:hypothetical protein
MSVYPRRASIVTRRGLRVGENDARSVTLTAGKNTHSDKDMGDRFGKITAAAAALVSRSTWAAVFPMIAIPETMIERLNWLDAEREERHR